MEPDGSLPCLKEPTIPVPCVTFRNMRVCYGEKLSALRQIRREEDHPLSAACAFCIFIAAFNSPRNKHHYNMLLPYRLVF